MEDKDYTIGEDAFNFFSASSDALITMHSSLRNCGKRLKGLRMKMKQKSNAFYVIMDE